VDSTPKDCGSIPGLIPISGPNGARRNVGGRSSRGEAPAQAPVPSHPGMHRPPSQGGLEPSCALQEPFEIPMRARSLGSMECREAACFGPMKQRHNGLCS
jgi:hypothetical protein